MLDGADKRLASLVAASIPEYMTMIAAGLAGTTPHMISATITAISRLVFEYKDEIPADMKSDLVATLLVFLSSNNREIVKSALGFVKVIVVSFPSLEIQPHLGSLVPGLLNWSHDHKNHFKGKVRHIFERLIRKVSYDDVKLAAEEAAAQSEDAPTQGTPDGVKFLENIRKRKERSKKKKAAAREANGDAQRDDDDDDDDRAPVARTTTGNAFDDALYGSESDMTDSETEEATGAQRGDQRGVKGKGKGKAKDNKGPGSTFLREDGDEPLDLLDRTLAGRLSSTSYDSSSFSCALLTGSYATFI
jgi:ribosomal RNA-processing protein 12